MPITTWCVQPQQAAVSEVCVADVLVRSEWYGSFSEKFSEDPRPHRALIDKLSVRLHTPISLFIPSQGVAIASFRPRVHGFCGVPRQGIRFIISVTLLKVCTRAFILGLVPRRAWRRQLECSLEIHCCSVPNRSELIGSKCLCIVVQIMHV